MARESRDVFQQPSAGTVTHDEPPPGIARGASQRTFFGHPVGLSTLFFTEMWERFSYYGIRPLLVLFMTAALAQGGFGFERTTASSIVGIYAACVYLASLPGGWIADRLLGLRRAIWYGGKQCLGVRHERLAIEIFSGRELDDFPEIHHCDAIRDVLYDRQIVRNEHVGEVVLALEILEKVDHLRLNRDIERGYRLVADDELWLDRERSRDPDTLTLSTREFVWVAVGVLGSQSYFL